MIVTVNYNTEKTRVSLPNDATATVQKALEMAQVRNLNAVQVTVADRVVGLCGTLRDGDVLDVMATSAKVG